jgi:hypothetical protein
MEMDESEVICEAAFAFLRGWCDDNPRHMSIKQIAQAVDSVARAYKSSPNQTAMEAANIKLIQRIAELRVKP